MPATVICKKCGQRMRSNLHHCTPNKVAKQERMTEKFGKL